jgi:hypothetical protein
MGCTPTRTEVPTMSEQAELSHWTIDRDSPLDPGDRNDVQLEAVAGCDPEESC